MIQSFRESARVVVTASFEKLSLQFSDTTEKGKVKANEFVKYMNSPEFQKAVRKNGRDGLVLLDGALKHPVVVTGVSKFARSKEIPYTDALLRLASLGLAKILKAIPEEIAVEDDGKTFEEIDAQELEQSCSVEEIKEAEDVGKLADDIPEPKVESQVADKNSEGVEEENGKCIVM